MPSIIGPVAGALVGGMMSDGGGGQQVSKDPWGPTQKPLTDMVNDGSNLYRYYQQNPFNDIQQTAYSNLFGDLDSFRGQNSGLMDFANRLMGTNYSRHGGPTNFPMPGLMGGGMRGPSGGGMGGGDAQALAGLLGIMRGQGGQGAQAIGGLLSSGPFAVPQGKSYGQVDFSALNPYTNGGIKPPEPESEDEKARKRKQAEEEDAIRQYMASERGGAGA